MYFFGQRSLANLAGVHPLLVTVARRAIEISTQDFAVFEGLRSLAKQRQYVARGVSRTLKSKHRVQRSTGFGHALDLVPFVDGRLDWSDDARWRYDAIETAMRSAATDLGVDDALDWGGDWRSFYDGPHWEVHPHRLERHWSTYV